MHNFQNIQKFPILILSGPRTGSTLLFNYISEIYPNLKKFNEPSRSQEELDKFLEIAKRTNQYIVKIHASHLYADWDGAVKFPQYIIDQFTRSSTMFKIVVKRSNVVQQIASRYLATIRDKWNYDIDDLSSEYCANVPMNMPLIMESIHSTKLCNEAYNRCKSIDAVAYYETIEKLRPPINSIKTLLPDNYSELKFTIEKIIAFKNKKRSSYKDSLLQADCAVHSF